jgi:hypothetical protein
MYCSTCGALIVEGRSRCDTCGAAVYRPPHAERAALPNPSVAATCPRCGYRGEGITYFSRGSHVAALVGITLLTAGMMGAGGLIYYLVRRDHLVCPRCGRGWGRNGAVALVPASAGGLSTTPMVRGGGGGMQGWAVALFVIAAMLAVAAIVSTELPPLLAAGIAAAGGAALSRAASRERERRREALLSALQLPVLQLAGRKGGQLTVTEVAAELGWTLRRAEKVLQSLDDGLRVTSDVTDEGVIVYAFPELTRSHNVRLPPPEEG